MAADSAAVAEGRRGRVLFTVLAERIFVGRRALGLWGGHERDDTPKGYPSSRAIFCAILTPMPTQVTFKGRKYLFFGESDGAGPIATARQYSRGDESYAYVTPNGTIMRLGRIIGSKSDLTFGRVVATPKSTTGSLAKVLASFMEGFPR